MINKCMQMLVTKLHFAAIKKYYCNPRILIIFLHRKAELLDTAAWEPSDTSALELSCTPALGQSYTSALEHWSTAA